MFSFTSFRHFSTIHSAASCLLQTAFAVSPCVRYRHRPRMEIITAQLLTWDSVIRIGITGAGISRKIRAPEIRTPSATGV